MQNKFLSHSPFDNDYSFLSVACAFDTIHYNTWRHGNILSDLCIFPMHGENQLIDGCPFVTRGWPVYTGASVNGDKDISFSFYVGRCCWAEIRYK